MSFNFFTHAHFLFSHLKKTKADSMNTVVIVVVVIVVVVLAFFALRGYSSKKPQVPQVDDRLNTDRRLPADDTKRPRRSRVIPT